MPRLSCTYTPTWTTVEWRIDIFDSQGGIFDPGLGPPGSTFCTDDQGAIIRMEGNSRDIYQAIQPSSCSFAMRIDSPATQSFLEDLALAEENRFSVKVSFGQFTRFQGNIVIDEIAIEDTWRSGYFITINATDGFADLQNIPYAYSDGTPYQYRVRVTEHLENIFAKLPTFDVYKNSSVYVYSSLFAAEMTDTNTCSLEQAWVDHAVFQDKREDEVVPWNCYDVLTAILDAWDMRLFTSGQHIYMVSWNFYAKPTTSIDSFIYSVSDWSGADHGSVSILPIPTCDSDVQAEEGGLRILQAPARSVTVHYNHGPGQNYMYGLRFMELRYLFQCWNIGQVPETDSDTRLHFTGNMRLWLSESHTLITAGVKFVLMIKIKLGNYYYAYPFTNALQHGYPYWTTNEEYYEIPGIDWISPYGESTAQEYTNTENFDILSEVLPAGLDGEDIDICFKIRLIDWNHNILPEMGYPAWISIENPNFAFVNADNVLVENTAKSVRVINTVKNNRDFTRTLVMGDGPTPDTNSRITVLDGTHKPTTEWTDYHSGIGPYDHTELIARSMMARRVNAVTYKEGAFIRYFNFLEPLDYKDLIYTPILGDVLTSDNRTRGEFVSISLGSVSGLDHTVVLEDEARLAPGIPARPDRTQVAARPIRKVYVGPLTQVTPHINIDFVLGLPTDEQAAIVHLYRNGVHMELSGTPSNIYDFQIIDDGGAKLRPAIPFTANDRIEYNIFL